MWQTLNTSHILPSIASVVRPETAQEDSQMPGAASTKFWLFGAGPPEGEARACLLQAQRPASPRES